MGVMVNVLIDNGTLVNNGALFVAVALKFFEH